MFANANVFGEGRPVGSWLELKVHSSIGSAISPILDKEMTVMMAVVGARPPSRNRGL